MCSTECEELVQKHHDEFLLMTIIAIRAKRTLSTSQKGLQIGEALISHTSSGLTRKRYRISLRKLIQKQFVAIRRASKGTIAKLLNTKIYDINPEGEGPSKGPSGGPSQCLSPYTFKKYKRKSALKSQKEEYSKKFD